ncbi:hypothetical protein B0A52_09395 [Exophiala mesophila]|uniref:Uncharacterized protein n=1 Tax=Exophiala mesophila TaxID=212818 RepID=A0A438MSI7_EXOME|nr:hypothetical protein B0A52_09395 [Exophiala mesophila]
MEWSLARALNERVDPDTDLGRILADSMAHVVPHWTTDARLGTSGCLLKDIGQCIIFLIQTASELSNHIITHQSIELYYTYRLEQNDQENNRANTEILHYLSETLDVLKLVSLPITPVVFPDS